VLACEVPAGDVKVPEKEGVDAGPVHRGGRKFLPKISEAVGRGVVSKSALDNGIVATHCQKPLHMCGADPRPRQRISK